MIPENMLLEYMVVKLIAVQRIKELINQYGTLKLNVGNSWHTFYYHGLTLIQAWISNCIHYKVRVEITY